MSKKDKSLSTSFLYTMIFIYRDSGRNFLILLDDGKIKDNFEKNENLLQWQN